jgi:Txe/YoeB family toxin of Txe-Axe toxin-antitoxin module
MTSEKIKDNILFNYTKRFEKDLKKFSSTDQKHISKQINKYAQMLADDEHGFYSQTYQPRKLNLAQGLDSSLYSLKINHQIRLIFTVDEDPIFGQIIFTLMRVVKHDDLSKTFSSIAESLYQNGYSIKQTL